MVKGWINHAVSLILVTNGSSTFDGDVESSGYGILSVIEPRDDSSESMSFTNETRN